MSNADNRTKNTYNNVILSIISNCASKVEGIASISYDPGISPISYGFEKNKKNDAIIINMVGNLLSIEIFVNVYYGFKIPLIICNLQEKIKTEIESNTAFKVKAVNVNVVGVTSNN